jgi:hypothetical protein
MNILGAILILAVIFLFLGWLLKGQDYESEE